MLFKSTTSEDELTEVEKTEDVSKKYQDEIKALTAQLKEYIHHSIYCKMEWTK